MKITEVKPICLRYSYKNSIMDGCNTCGRREAFLLQIKTDCGLEGIGEAATFGLPLAAFQAVTEQTIAPLLIGEDPLKTEYLWERLIWCSWAGGRKGLVRGVASAADIALWDILGKACNMPICRILGQNSDRIQAYASAGFYAEGKDTDILKQEFEGYLKRGYKAFKMKVGRTKEGSAHILRYMPEPKGVITRQCDEERVKAVRAVVGKNAPLMLDMNNTWEMDAALRSADFLREMNIYAVEEPVCGTDIRGYQQLKTAWEPVLRAGGENEQGTERYKQLLDEDMLDLVQTNLGWSGGITEGRRIAALCLAAGKLFAPHTFFSAVLTAANVQLSASLPNVPFIESEENPNPLREKLLKTPFERDRDMAYLLTDRPGLGIELNWDVIEQYHI